MFVQIGSAHMITSIEKNFFLLCIFVTLVLSYSMLQSSSTLFLNNHSISPVSVATSSVATSNVHEKISEDQIIQYLQFRLNDMKLAQDLNFNIMARGLLGQSLSEIEDIIDEMILLALNNNSIITMNYFNEAYLIVLRGLKNKIVDDLLLYDIAIHEAGHIVALIYKLSDIQLLHNATIESRGDSLGESITHALLTSNILEIDIDTLMNRIIFCLCGGIANQIFAPSNLNYKDFNNFLSVFENSTDILQARNFAKKIIMKKYGAFHNILNFDDQLEVNDLINEILEQCYDQAWSFIYIHQEEVVKVAEFLLANHTVSGDEIYNLLGIDKPIYDFEEGPLPKSLVENYKLRESKYI